MQCDGKGRIDLFVRAFDFFAFVLVLRSLRPPPRVFVFGIYMFDPT